MKHTELSHVFGLYIFGASTVQSLGEILIESERIERCQGHL